MNDNQTEKTVEPGDFLTWLDGEWDYTDEKLLRFYNNIDEVDGVEKYSISYYLSLGAKFRTPSFENVDDLLHWCNITHYLVINSQREDYLEIANELMEGAYITYDYLKEDRQTNYPLNEISTLTLLRFNPTWESNLSNKNSLYMVISKFMPGKYDSYADLFNAVRYLVEEHQCLVNNIDVEAVICDRDVDRHGCFEVIRVLPMALAVSQLQLPRADSILPSHYGLLFPETLI